MNEEKMKAVWETEVIEIEKRWERRFQIFEDGLKFEENLSDSERHLDFGCGFGAFAKILAEKFPSVQVYGIDSDEEKIEIGKKRYKLANLHLLYA